MDEIRSPKQLRDWLLGKPDGWAQAIAVRSAMRAWVRIADADLEWIEQNFLNLICGLSRSWLRQIVRYNDDLDILQVIGEELAEIANFAASTNSMGVAFASDTISFSALSYISKSADYAADAYAALIAINGYFLEDEIVMALNQDCQFLLDLAPASGASQALVRTSLWHEHTPGDFNYYWQKLSSILINLDVSNAVWVQWFDRRISGARSAFDIPGDIYFIEDKRILVNLAATSRNFWEKGAYYVNTTLKGWLDEARLRVSPIRPNPVEVGEKLLDSASPQARVVEGKLDAVPNARFDVPQYSDVLSDLPSEMNAFLTVLEGSIPRNCPIIIRNCIKGYLDELLVRGNRPIVNILTGMASAIAAQFWVIGELAEQLNPDTWQVRHPEEWDAGTVDLIRTFFKKHLDLISHFPLNDEREMLIASTPIDEVNASGPALTDPIQAINDLIVGLNKDGMATDNIVKIMNAHVLYARDISGLPAPMQPIAEQNVVTPKRRFVLNSAGFYLHAYSVLGSTASLASSPQVVALMEKLSHAAQVMLGFIR
jgi:hypothetical protein